MVTTDLGRAVETLMVVDAALAEIVDVWGTCCTVDDLGERLTCSEVEALAHLLALVDESMAEQLLDSHSRGDEDGDNEDHVRRGVRLRTPEPGTEMACCESSIGPTCNHQKGTES